jgi:ribosomal protein L11 methyltransferase
MKLGAASAIGVDIDEDALLAARHNAMQNRTAVDFQSAHASSTTICDIVIANILARPLRLLAPLLAQATRTGGRVALSGVLEYQADEVIDVYRAWYDMDEPQRDEGWVQLSGVRRDDQG